MEIAICILFLPSTAEIHVPQDRVPPPMIQVVLANRVEGMDIIKTQMSVSAARDGKCLPRNSTERILPPEFVNSY